MTISGVSFRTKNLPHLGTQEAKNTHPIHLHHLHVFGWRLGSTQSGKGSGSRYPLPGFTTLMTTSMGKPPLRTVLKCTGVG